MRPPTPVPPPDGDRTVARFDPSSLGFEQPERRSDALASVPSGGMPRALREAAVQAGMDPLAELFNEALGYAQEGHLRLARERLTVLLCMAPDDGEARLLLAQVHVADHKWDEALRALDEARDYGADVPRELRRSVEEQLLADQAYEEEQRSAITARTLGDAETVRSEVQRLRTDNQELTGQLAVLHREVRKWTWATLGVSVLSIACVAGLLVWGAMPREEMDGGVAAAATTPVPSSVAAVGPALQDEAVPPMPVPPLVPVVIDAAPPPVGSVVDAPASTTEVIDAPPTLIAAPAPEPVQPAPSARPDVKMGFVGAASVLPTQRSTPDVVPYASQDADPIGAAKRSIARSDDMAGAAVQLVLSPDGRLMVTGTVQNFTQRKAMEKMLLGIDGVEKIDVSRTVALSRSEGTSHLVVRGDNLSEIAYAYYGNGMLTEPIEKANDVSADTLRPGMNLVIPAL